MSTENIIKKYFSNPHERGKTVNFSKIIRQEKILQALNKIKNRKPGQTVVLKLNGPSNRSPLNTNNLKRRVTHHRSTSPKRGSRIVSVRPNTSHLRKSLLTRVNNIVNFYSKFPEFIKMNFKNEKKRNNLQKKINVYLLSKQLKNV